MDKEFTHFTDDVGREIFTAWRKTDDLSSLKETLDPALHEKLDAIRGKSLTATKVEQKYADCVLS